MDDDSVSLKSVFMKWGHVLYCIAQLLLLQGEVQVACAGLDLVLGFQMGHALCGDAVDGEDGVSDADFGFGCLASICQLRIQTKVAKVRTVCKINQILCLTHFYF